MSLPDIDMTLTVKEQALSPDETLCGGGLSQCLGLPALVVCFVFLEL